MTTRPRHENILSEDEIALLTERHRNGDDAAGWRLVQCARGIVIMLFQQRRYPRHLLLDDLLQEFGIVLFNAFRRSFDPAKGKLSTFVTTVFHRRIDRVRKQICASAHQQVSDSEKLDKAIETDDRLSELAEVLGQSKRLPDVAVLILALHFADCSPKETIRRVEEQFPRFFRYRSFERRRQQLLEVVAIAIAILKEELL